MSSYRELKVWQKAMEATALTYALVKKLPREEMYSLTDQMKRAAVSIPSNIAEGQERVGQKDFARFVNIALGSKAELETQLLISVKVGYLTEDDIEPVMEMLAETGRMLSGLMRSLR